MFSRGRSIRRRGTSVSLGRGETKIRRHWDYENCV